MDKRMKSLPRLLQSPVKPQARSGEIDGTSLVLHRELHSRPTSSHRPIIYEGLLLFPHHRSFELINESHRFATCSICSKWNNKVDLPNLKDLPQALLL